MSSSDPTFGRRALLALLGALPLAACGFEPAFGPKGAASGLMGQVAFIEPRSRDAFDLVGRLQERLGRATNPRWRLGFKMTLSQEGLGITSDNVTTRYDLLGKVDWTMTDLATDKVVASGSTESFTAYSASGTVVSTATSERDAHQRLMRILADQIVTDLIATPGFGAAP